MRSFPALPCVTCLSGFYSLISYSADTIFALRQSRKKKRTSFTSTTDALNLRIPTATVTDTTSHSSIVSTTTTATTNTTKRTKNLCRNNNNNNKMKKNRTS